MTSPEDIEKTWGSAEGLPRWEQGDLFDLPDFPGAEEEMIVAVPLTTRLVETPNGQKMVPVSVPESWDKETFRRAMAAAYQVYLEGGNLNEGRIAALSGLSEATIAVLKETEEFNYALACRGVDTGATGTLTPQQDYALMILTDIGGKKTWAQRLREAGISHAIFTTWLQNPTFAKRWRELSENLAANHNLALVQLGQQVGEGNMRAIELSLEVSGRHDRSQIANLNIMMVMNRILEILATKLSDQPDLLRDLAAEFRTLGQQMQLNGNMIGSRIIEGESGIEF